jgi:integrase
MNKPFTPPVTALTLQAVLDRISTARGLPDSRKRDLRSAVTSFATLTDRSPAAIPLDLPSIRETLDAMVPASAKISAKRWANLRSDLAAAIAASGLQPMLKTANVDLDEDWGRLLATADRRIVHNLSRFARWACLRTISPEAVDSTTIERFVAELDAATLVRNLRSMAGTVARAWNTVVRLHPASGLHPVALPTEKREPIRIWQQLPASFQNDVARYLTWASVPDPLAEGARQRALSALSRRLQRTHIASAANAAMAAGIPVDRLRSLADLVEPETFRAVLLHRWREDGRMLTAFTHGIAITLIDIASNWVKAPADIISTLKTLRGRLGTVRSGLTEKNQALLRKFDDPRLAAALVQLPDKLWQAARRRLATSRRPFIDLQSALAIDLLVHVPALRMQNLSSLRFDTHLHWPQGRRKPALITFGDDETKNNTCFEFELPTALAERLQIYRNEITPAVTGQRPDTVFVTFKGKPRTQAAIKIAIERTVLRKLGVKLTPHQFRHLAAKFALDANPGAHELVRQLLAHKNLKTTTNFYAGLDTRRAGRAHADLIMKLREAKLNPRRRRRTPRSQEDQPCAGRSRDCSCPMPNGLQTTGCFGNGL